MKNYNIYENLRLYLIIHVSKVKVTLRSDPKRTLGEEAGTQNSKFVHKNVGPHWLTFEPAFGKELFIISNVRHNDVIACVS